VHSDCLAPRIEVLLHLLHLHLLPNLHLHLHLPLLPLQHLCALLAGAAARLEHLHLPVGTNLVLRAASGMVRLRALRADRTVGFNRIGLQVSGLHARLFIFLLVSLCICWTQ
jgi:hypothetical protein